MATASFIAPLKVERIPPLFTVAPYVAKAAETLGLTVHGHIVIGRAGHASFKGMGLL